MLVNTSCSCSKKLKLLRLALMAEGSAQAQVQKYRVRIGTSAAQVLSLQVCLLRVLHNPCLGQASIHFNMS